jgi:hypothetical protein
MKQHEIVFSLNNEEKVIISLQEPLESVASCYEEYIFLLYNKTKLLLAEGPIYYNMQQFVTFLKSALNNELLLDESITSDVGYLLNEYHSDENGFVIYNFPSGVLSWVGYKYHLWEATSDELRLISWIYNNPEGSIIFEVTPFYPYMYCDPEEEPNYVSYEEWIKTYKPYFIREISIAVAQEWLKQAEFILKTIENNIEKCEE